MLSQSSDYLSQKFTTITFSSQSWTVLTGIEQIIKSKIESSGIPLKNWDIKIYRGILTGYNEAFIIDQKTRDKLVDASSKNEEIIRPYKYSFLNDKALLLYLVCQIVEYNIRLNDFLQQDNLRF